jgi:hypothetical protein
LNQSAPTVRGFGDQQSGSGDNPASPPALKPPSDSGIESSGIVFQPMIPEVDADRGLDADPAGNSSRIPARIGRYRVDRLLGKGGFGLVYLGFDEQLQRKVAIKVPHPKVIAKNCDISLYLNEARAVANLDHPNIVPIHDVGGAEEFPFFFVSKFIDGCDLTTRLKSGQMSQLESARLVAIVAFHPFLSWAMRRQSIWRANLILNRFRMSCHFTIQSVKIAPRGRRTRRLHQCA